MNDELSIVNPGVTVLNGHIYVWFDRRKDGLVRHEVFFWEKQTTLN